RMKSKEVVWVQKAQKGDQKALNRLLKLYYQQLYKTAYLYVRNEADALDIVQEAVIKVIHKIEQLRSTEFFSSWLIRIVIFTALDYLKRKDRHCFSLTEENIETNEQLSVDETLDLYAASHQ